MKTNIDSLQTSALSPKTILRLENALIAAFSAWGFFYLGGVWWVFVALFLVPDLGMVGYLAGNKIGADVYNFFHTHSLPIGLFLLGVFVGSSFVLQASAVWFFHIAFDRAMGYGLKLPSGFRDTHIG